MTVIGVVGDFHLTPLSQTIRPLFIANTPDHKFIPMRYLSIKIKPVNVEKTLTHIEKIWKEFFPGMLFSFTFLDELFNRQFKNIERSRTIFSYFALLAIIIACLGLFGMAAFTAEQRTKEIGIRKVLGSSTAAIFYLLNKELLLKVAIASILAWPATYFIFEKWLESFPYHMDIDFPLFFFVSVLVFAIGLTAVSFRSLKAARGNPVEALRYE